MVVWDDSYADFSRAIFQYGLDRQYCEIKSRNNGIAAIGDSYVVSQPRLLFLLTLGLYYALRKRDYETRCSVMYDILS